MSEFGLYWWHPQKRDGRINLGDEISPVVLGHVTGRQPVWAPLEACDGIAIGSVFYPRRAKAKKRETPLFVWGSGTLAPSPAEFGKLSVQIAALRGPRTAGEIAGLGEVPFGDPGLFVREIWAKSTLPSGKVGLIPHHGMLRSPKVTQLASALEGAEVIDFTEPDIAATLERLSQCRLIVSSSLHGLIIADAYGIPSLFWNEGGAENEWKYRDYFEGVGRDGFEGLTSEALLTRLAVDGVEGLPYSMLAEGKLAGVLEGLRVAAAAMPEGTK